MGSPWRYTRPRCCPYVEREQYLWRLVRLERESTVESTHTLHMVPCSLPYLGTTPLSLHVEKNKYKYWYCCCTLVWYRTPTPRLVLSSRDQSRQQPAGAACGEVWAREERRILTSFLVILNLFPKRRRHRTLRTVLETSWLIFVRPNVLRPESVTCKTHCAARNAHCPPSAALNTTLI